MLAGDHLKAASDLGVPLVAVGLLYRSGYFRQSLALDGWQVETYPVLDPQGLPLHLLTGNSGEPVLVTVNMPGGRMLSARVWRAAVGRVPLLLLDSDIEENDPDLRGVTDRLYGGDQNHRIRQEILVGVGGVRAVRAFCAVVGSPRARRCSTPTRDTRATWAWSASGSCRTPRGSTSTRRWPWCARARSSPRTRRCPRASTGSRSTWCATTSTTPRSRRRCCPACPTDRVLALGAEDNPSMFNMAHMGLRLAQRANGVSKLHGAVSRGMFGGLWSGFDTVEVPIGSVTNGVHGQTWEAREVTALIGPPAPHPAAHDGEAPSDAVLWDLRTTLRDPAGRARCAAGCARRGCSAARPCRS